MSTRIEKKPVELLEADFFIGGSPIACRECGHSITRGVKLTQKGLEAMQQAYLAGARMLCSPCGAAAHAALLRHQGEPGENP